MDKDKQITEVIFRVFKNGGDVIAIFPYLIADMKGNSESYQHTGQHGACDLRIIYDTKLATPLQYADLKAELENNFGYNFKVIKKVNYKRLSDLRGLVLKDIYNMKGK